MKQQLSRATIVAIAAGTTLGAVAPAYAAGHVVNSGHRHAHASVHGHSGSGAALARIIAHKDARLARVLDRLDGLASYLSTAVADNVAADRATLASSTDAAQVRHVRPEN